MAVHGWLRAALVLVALGAAQSAGAQPTTSTTDIQRLQDQVFQAGAELSRLRSTDASLASRLESDLDDIREEVVYLKVKLRREGSVNRSEYSDLRDRLQDLRARARGETVTGGSSNESNRGTRGTGRDSGVYGGTATQETTPGTRSGSSNQGSRSGGGYGDDRTSSTGSRTGDRSAIPVGQEIDVRLQSQLSSDTAEVEDRFEATTAADLYRGNEVLVPAGSVVRGVVSSVNRASRTDRKGQLTVAFDQITINGRTYPMRGTVTEALESEGIRGEAARIGAGSAVGAIIGGIMGGVKGALLGVLIGGGGTIAATEGKDVTLPAGTILRVRLDTPPEVR